MQLLFNKEDDINPRPPRGTFGNPLQAAAHSQEQNMVKLLLDFGADVNAVGSDWGTALQAAVSKAADAVITLLLDAGTDVTLESGKVGVATASLRLEWASSATFNCS